MATSDARLPGVPPGAHDPPDPDLNLPALARLLAEELAPLLRPGAEPLLDRPALARRVGVGERTVSVLVARGELPPPLLHTGGVARWSWPQVVKYLESRQGRRTPRRGRGRYDRAADDSDDTKAEGG
jgi:hypothetical protein